jgi:hypothetical protein
VAVLGVCPRGSLLEGVVGDYDQGTCDRPFVKEAGSARLTGLVELEFGIAVKVT